MIDRTFYPGQEWVYFKVYLKPESADMVLVNYVCPFIKRCFSRHVIGKWFFIRYSDPEYHLRIRLKLESSEALGTLLESFYKKLSPLTKSHVVSRIVIDTYVREVERYEPLGMELCESIFECDSNLVCDVLRRGDTLRWVVGATIALYLSRFFYADDESIYRFMSQRAEAYSREFNFNRGSLKQFNAIYRQRKSVLDKIVDGEYKDPFSSRYMLSPVVSSMLRDYAPIESVVVLPSLIHMHFNRLFTTSQRLAECVCYILLERAIKSKVARNKAKLVVGE